MQKSRYLVLGGNDLKKGKEKVGENPQKRPAENIVPKLILGGNDRPRLATSIWSFHPDPPRLEIIKTRDPKRVDPQERASRGVCKES